MRASSDIGKLLTALNDSVVVLGDATESRNQARAIASILAAVRGIGRAAMGGRSGKAAILAYLVDNFGTPLDGSEIEAVSGIPTYARRIRELRAEGWRIAGGTKTPASAADRRVLRELGIGHLKSSEYVLTSRSPRRHSFAAEQLTEQMAA